MKHLALLSSALLAFLAVAQPVPGQAPSDEADSVVWTMKQLKLRETASIMVVLSHPLLQTDRRPQATCDFLVSRPDTSHALELKDVSCFDVVLPAKVDSPPFYVALDGGKGDPLGRWTIDIRMRDASSGTEVPIRQEFVRR